MRRWIYLLMLLLSIQLIQAVKMYVLEHPFITKQSYFWEYIDQDITCKNLTECTLTWWADPYVFQAIDCAYSKNEKCIGDLSKKYNSTVKDYKEKTKLTSYSINDFKDSYFKDKKNFESDIIKLKDGMPKIVYNGNISIQGEIRPLTSSEGKIKIIFRDNMLRNPDTYFRIGFGSLLAQMSNGYSAETLDFDFYKGFLRYDNYTRFLKIPLYANVTKANLSLKPLQEYNAIYKEFDYFKDSSINHLIWETATTSTTCGAYSTASQISESSNIQLRTWGECGGTFYSQIKTNSSYYNFNKNQSVSLYWTYYLAFENTAATLWSRYEVILTNGSAEVVLDSTTISFPGPPYTVTGTNYYNFEINKTSKKVYKINATSGAVLSTISTATVSGGTQNFLFRVSGSSSTTPRYYEAKMNIYYMGYTTNKTLYNKWYLQASYPKYSYLKLANFSVWSNTTTLTSSKNIDINVSLRSVLDNGCTCSFCTLEGYYCYVPIVIGAKGGDLRYNNISVEYNITALNISIYDEITNELFNLSNTTDLKLSVHFTDRTVEHVITDNTLLEDIGIDWSLMKVDIIYPDSSYFRTITNLAQGNMLKLYLADATKYTVYQIVLKLNDLTGQYSNSQIIIRKNFGTESAEIIAQPFDAENKATLYLIKDAIYSISIRNTQGEERSLGNFIADSSGEKTITIPQINFVPDSNIGDTIFWDWQSTNESLRLVYNDTSSMTDSVRFIVYDADDSSILYNLLVASSHITFSYPIDNISSYLACFNATHQTEGQIYECSAYTNGQLQKPTDTTKIKFNFWLVVFIICVALLTASSGDAANSMMVATIFLFICQRFKWITFGWKWDTFIISFGALVTVLLFWIEGEKK